MKRLSLFLTSWPVVTVISAAAIIALVWPEGAKQWLRTWLIVQFLMGYLS